VPNLFEKKTRKATRTTTTTTKQTNKTKQYFSYIVAVSLLVEETGVPGKNHQHAASH